MAEYHEESMVKFMVGANQVKYDVLKKLFADVDASIYRGCILYLDGHTLLRRFYREKKQIQAIVAGDPEDGVRDLVVAILNVLGHYRRFAATRLHLDNDVYLTFNRVPAKFNVDNYPKFYADRVDLYREDHPDFGYFNKLVNRAWDFIVELSPYFENLYCINAPGVDDQAVAYRYGIGEDKDLLHLIISSNLYPFQLLAENTILLHPRRDDSYLVTVDDCYGKLLEIAGVKKVPDTRALTPDMLPLLWSLTGLREVSMKRSDHINGFGTMVKLAVRMAEDGALVPDMSARSFLNVVGHYVKTEGTAFRNDREKLEGRCRALSIPLAAKAITLDQRMKISSQLYNLYDENELEDLNDLLARSRTDPELLKIESLNMSRKVGYGG